jgi:hypothetical protein
MTGAAVVRAGGLCCKADLWRLKSHVLEARGVGGLVFARFLCGKRLWGAVLSSGGLEVMSTPLFYFFENAASSFAACDLLRQIFLG